jgi:hypothetical protein
VEAVRLSAQRLLKHDRKAQRLFGHNPFPDAPPKQIRVSVLGMTPTRVSELRATGQWWHVRRLGTLLPARGHETWPDRLYLPEPEVFHPDLVAVRRRAKPLRDIVEAYRSGMPFDQAAIAGSDLTADDVERFWTELVPELAQARGDWSQIHARREAALARFGVEGLFRFERVLAAVITFRGSDMGAASVEQGLPGIFEYYHVLSEVVPPGEEFHPRFVLHPDGEHTIEGFTRRRHCEWIFLPLTAARSIVHRPAAHRSACSNVWWLQ